MKIASAATQEVLYSDNHDTIVVFIQKDIKNDVFCQDIDKDWLNTDSQSYQCGLWSMENTYSAEDLTLKDKKPELIIIFGIT